MWDEVRESCIDLWVNVVAASPRGCDYLNMDRGGGLFPQILILLQSPFVQLVKQVHDRRQLLKIQAVTHVIYGIFLWALCTTPTFQTLGRIQFQRFPVPDSGN